MSAAAKISARLDGRTVLVVGRAGMDLYPLPDGSTIEAATGFVSDVGGSAGNIAVALARLGGKAALLSAFSDDAIGRFVMNSLENYSVDTAHCRILTGLERTSLAMAESRADAPSVVIYRNNAADLGITAEQVAAIDLEATGAIIITGTALSREPSRHACRLLTERADAAGCPVILDIDYRPQAWESSNEAADVLGDLAQRADMVVGGRDRAECAGCGDGVPVRTGAGSWAGRRRGAVAGGAQTCRGKGSRPDGHRRNRQGRQDHQGRRAGRTRSRRRRKPDAGRTATVGAGRGTA